MKGFDHMDVNPGDTVIIQETFTATDLTCKREVQVESGAVGSLIRVGKGNFWYGLHNHPGIFKGEFKSDKFKIRARKSWG